MSKRTDNKPTKSVRYRLDPGIFHDPRFQKLPGAEPSSAQLLLNLLVGPLAQKARIPGLVSAGVGTLADHLRWHLSDVQTCLYDLTSAKWIMLDADRNRIWVPHVAKTNLPDSPSVIQGWAMEWQNVGAGPLHNQIWEDLYAVIEPLGDPWFAVFKEVFETVTRDCEIHGVQHPGGTPWRDTVGGHRVLAAMSAGWFPQPVNGENADNCLKYLNGELIAARDLIRGEAPGAPAVSFRLGVSVRCLSSSERSEEDTQDLKGKATPRKTVPRSPTPISPAPDTPRVVPCSPRDTLASLRPIPGSPDITPVSPGVSLHQDNPPSTAAEVDGDSEGDDEDFEPASEAVEASPFNALYFHWNRLADIPGSQIHQIVAAEVPKFDGLLNMRIETDPRFIATVEGLIDGIAEVPWMLGTIPFKDGKPYRMYFTVLLTRTDWVRDKLTQHHKERKRKEQTSKPSKASGHGRGPRPISKFAPEPTKTEGDQPNHTTADPYIG